MYTHFVGIDISKRFFDASVEVGGKTRHHQFSNNENGFESFLEWCKKWKVIDAHFCMEATGAYWVEISAFLHKSENAVSVVNPACIKRFAQSELKRTKADKVDAGVIARFCKAMNPSLWEPLPAEAVELQKLVRRHYDLTKMRQQERNRLKSESFDEVTMASVERMLKFIEEEIARIDRRIDGLYKKHDELRRKRDLLLTIPGVGDLTANVVLAEVPNTQLLSTAKQLAAYAGLAPREFRSGDTIRGRTRLSKTGRSLLRTVLYLPAVSSRKYNPVIHTFAERLLKNGKPHMKVVCASMRKLLHIIFGVLKSGKPFCADLAAA